MTWDTTWYIYLDTVGININLLILSLIVLCIGLYKRKKGVDTSLFWLSFWIAFVGVAYWTLHGRLLQKIIPFPENPFDLNTIANYSLTVALTFVFFPLLLLYISKQLDVRRLGLKVENLGHTLRLTIFGAGINLLLSALPIAVSILAVWGYKWPFEYTTLGLALWFVLVCGVATWMQVFFFLGILFHNYLNSENAKLLFLASMLTFLMFIPLSLFTPFFIAQLGVEAYVTAKTGNVYGAMLIHSLGVIVSTILVII
jgi:hypothetical protein